MSLGENGCVMSLARPLIALLLFAELARAELPVAEVEGQPLGANAARVIKALEFLGVPLGEAETKQLQVAIEKRDAMVIQKMLDPHVLAAVSVNPELRVKVQRGPAKAELRQGGFTPFLVKCSTTSPWRGRCGWGVRRQAQCIPARRWESCDDRLRRS